MAECECGGGLERLRLSPDEGFVLYKYYRDDDVIEHYRRYELFCERCKECGREQPFIEMKIPNGLHGDKANEKLTDVLDGEGYCYEKCPACGGRLITDMAALGTAGKCLQRFSQESFLYSTVTFDSCADCGMVSNIREKPMR